MKHILRISKYLLRFQIIYVLCIPSSFWWVIKFWVIAMGPIELIFNQTNLHHSDELFKFLSYNNGFYWVYLQLDHSKLTRKSIFMVCCDLVFLKLYLYFLGQMLKLFETACRWGLWPWWVSNFYEMIWYN